MNGSANYKTKQREAILNFLLENQACHVTVNDISEHLEKDNIHVGVTTIYRHLEKLREQGIVRKFTIDGSTSACFQYSGEDEKCHEHFHLMCEKCGKLIHLECRQLNQIARHIYDEHGFKINLFRTVFYGICSECAKKIVY